MAMTTGTVAVAQDGSVVKSGAAEAAYDSLVASFGGDIPTGPDGAAVKINLGKIAEAIAATITYIQANAQLRVFAADDSLQKSTSVGVLTAAPDADQIFGEVI